MMMDVGTAIEGRRPQTRFGDINRSIFKNNISQNHHSWLSPTDSETSAVLRSLDADELIL